MGQESANNNQDPKELVFISYSRKDSAFVDRLVDDLLACGIRAWMDRRDITASENWDEAVSRAIDAAHLMIIVITGDSMASTNVIEEITAFKDQKDSEGREYPILPIWLKDLDETDIYFRIRRPNRVDFRPPHTYEQAFDELKRALKRLGITCAGEADRPLTDAGTVPPSEHAPQPHPEPVPHRRAKTPRILLALAAVVAVVAVVLLLMQPDDGNQPGAETLTATSEFRLTGDWNATRAALQTAAAHATETAAADAPASTVTPQDSTPTRTATPEPPAVVTTGTPDRTEIWAELHTAAAQTAASVVLTQTAAVPIKTSAGSMPPTLTPNQTATAAAARLTPTLTGTPDRTATWGALKTEAAHATETAQP